MGVMLVPSIPGSDTGLLGWLQPAEAQRRSIRAAVTPVSRAWHGEGPAVPCATFAFILREEQLVPVEAGVPIKKAAPHGPGCPRPLLRPPAPNASQALLPPHLPGCCRRIAACWTPASRWEKYCQSTRRARAQVLQSLTAQGTHASGKAQYHRFIL